MSLVCIKIRCCPLLTCSRSLNFVANSALTGTLRVENCNRKRSEVTSMAVSVGHIEMTNSALDLQVYVAQAA